MPADEVLVQWAPVTEPAGVEIVAYQVLVADESVVPAKEFSAHLPANAVELSVPSQFVQSGVEYKVEVVAIEASGNQTLSGLTFTAE